MRAANPKPTARARAGSTGEGALSELNPTELLNQDVKTNALGRRRPRTQDELIGETRSYLRSRQRTPRIVARYFEEKQVSYAKAA